MKHSSWLLQCVVVGLGGSAGSLAMWGPPWGQSPTSFPQWGAFPDSVLWNPWERCPGRREGAWLCSSMCRREMWPQDKRKEETEQEHGQVARLFTREPFSTQCCMCSIKLSLNVTWKHWIKALGKTGIHFQKQLYSKHKVPLLLVGRAYSPVPSTVQGHRGRCFKQPGTKTWCFILRGLGWGTYTVGTSFSTHPTMFLCWLLEKNRPFQMSCFRLRWATDQRMWPSMDPANPHHIRVSPPPGLPQNHVLVLPSHHISVLCGWQHWWSAALPPSPVCHSGTGHVDPWEMWLHVPWPQWSQVASGKV